MTARTKVVAREKGAKFRVVLVLECGHRSEQSYRTMAGRAKVGGSFLCLECPGIVAAAMVHK